MITSCHCERGRTCGTSSCTAAWVPRSSTSPSYRANIHYLLIYSISADPFCPGLRQNRFATHLILPQQQTVKQYDLWPCVQGQWACSWAGAEREWNQQNWDFIAHILTPWIKVGKLLEGESSSSLSAFPRPNPTKSVNKGVKLLKTQAFLFLLMGFLVPRLDPTLRISTRH